MKSLLSKINLSIFISLVLLLACSSERDNPNVLLRTDSAFSQMVLDSGMKKAFKHFAANKLTEFNLSTMFNDKESAKDSAINRNMLLIWTPLKANVSKDGDLGWTAGTWFKVIKFLDKLDTVKTGSYVTFWEKQDNGSWRYIVDKGNLSPKDFK